jgi:nucleoside-diphosphate-sugar epimerase
MRILILGGTLFIGRRLTRRLADAGHDVTVLHRSLSSNTPSGVSQLIADRNDASSVRRALAGQRFDAVFDNVYDWERGTTGEQVAATAHACASDALRRYVFMSSVAAYGAGLDHVEDDPLAPPDDPDPYVRNKADSERVLFGMHQRDGFPAVTLRPPFVYGPENPMYREAFFWDRLRDHRPIIVPDDGRRLMQFAYVDDIVTCAERILHEPRAVGKAFNVADAGAITQRQAVEACARAAAREAHIVNVPREAAIAAGGHPMGPKLYFAMYYDLPPITMRIDRARDVLGFEPTDFNLGLARTYEWWSRENPFPRPDYAFEDMLIRQAAARPS